MYKNHKVGEIGENVAERFLVKHGFRVIERNYRKKWGEIDIITKKSGNLHFVEVKTVSCENLENVSREIDSFQPEENVHEKKLQRLARTTQSYLLENDIEDDWQLDVVVVFLDLSRKKAKCHIIEDIIF